MDENLTAACWGDTLYANKKQYLSAGDYLQSNNLKYRLVYQPDGNLVIYEGVEGPVTYDYEQAYWSSKTIKKKAWRAYMEPWGEFVIYSSPEDPVYVKGRNGAMIRMEDGGTLTIYDANNKVVWRIVV